MVIINIILCIILISLIIYVNQRKKKITQIDSENIKKNEFYQRENTRLLAESVSVQKNLDNLNDSLYRIKCEETQELQRLKTIQEQVQQTQTSAEQVAQKAFENYHEVLQKAYEDAEEEYNACKEYLMTSYDIYQAECQKKMDNINAELLKMQNTHKAVVEAAIRQDEIKKQLSFYCLPLKENEINDIQILERIKPQLNNPRVLSMLIWSTFFQKEMTALCNRVLGTATVTGIYKITNQKNNKCYIGQSVDIAKRWKDHAKCGLGIDTPQGNKLYKEMKEIGIWNFSWELLEKCSREELNEKEKYYINFYQSKDYGYNTTKGNN